MIAVAATMAVVSIAIKIELLHPEDKPLYLAMRTLIMTNLKFFIDIDGVLANWEWGVNNLLGLKHINVQNYHVDKNLYAPQYYGAIKEYQREGGLFWYDLPMLSGVGQLWAYLHPFKPTVITAIGNNDLGAEKQKRDWIRMRFGEKVEVLVVIRTKEKHLYAQPNYVLIDDQQRALNGWIEHGGIGILHRSSEETIRQLRTLS